MRRSIDGEVFHPAIDVSGKHFYAMSLYFYALDCLREISEHPIMAGGNTKGEGGTVDFLRNWPRPTLAELSGALREFCALSWETINERLDVKRVHTFTSRKGFPHRCLEGVYIVTLLRDGFGFESDGRSVSFLYDIEGSEVEWSIGALLVDSQNKK